MHNEISALDFSHDGKIFATAGKVGSKFIFSFIDNHYKNNTNYFM